MRLQNLIPGMEMWCKVARCCKRGKVKTTGEAPGFVSGETSTGAPSVVLTAPPLYNNHPH